MHYFKFSPSRVCAALLISVHTLAILIVFLLPIAGLAQAISAILLLLALRYHLYRDAWLRLPSSHVAMHLQGNNIILITRSGEELHTQLLLDSVVTPALTILNVIPQGKRIARSVIIFPDTLDQDSNRELRVLLRWGREINP